MKKRSLSFTPLQIAVHIAAWIPLAWMIWDYFQFNLTANPIQNLTQRTGKAALIFLVLSLAATPANTLFGWRQALKVRRALGLYAFGYAAVHFWIFLAWDYGFAWDLLRAEIIDKSYILVGASTLTILTALAATSFRWWMKRLGKNWKRLHKLVYLAGGLVIIHFAWASKGDLFSLQGDIWEPLAYGLAVALLLIVRIPSVRKRASGLRRRLAARLAETAARQPEGKSAS